MEKPNNIKIFSSIEEAQKEYNLVMQSIESIKMEDTVNNFQSTLQAMNDEYQAKMKEKNGIIDSFKHEVNQLRELLDDKIF